MKLPYNNRRMPAEWEPQSAVLLAWPHADTDWAYMLDEAVACYRDIVRTMLAAGVHVIVVTPTPNVTKQQIGYLGNLTGDLNIFNIPTNDTWIRDYGPITIYDDGVPVVLDFAFNAWGMKFAADLDNRVTRRLRDDKLFHARWQNYLDFVLEGGSIESDGNGTIMTTSYCLLAPNRNDRFTQDEIEKILCVRLGARQVLWVDYGGLDGDDTDGHIDTLARFAPGGVILYSPSSDPESTVAMVEQLEAARDVDGKPYRLVALPEPDLIMAEGQYYPLPATYANYLVFNGHVFVPTYRQPENDAEAMRIIGAAHPGRTVIGIDCTALIHQHGSLHCATMQLPQHTLVTH